MQTNTDQLNKITGSLLKACNDTNAMLHDYMSASLQSVTVMTKGCGDVFDSVNSLMQKSLEQSAEASRNLMGIKTMQDWMDMQSNLLKTGYDSMMEEMSKITQISARMTQQAAEPVTSQVSATICKFSRTKVA